MRKVRRWAKRHWFFLVLVSMLIIGGNIPLKTAAVCFVAVFAVAGVRGIYLSVSRKDPHVR